MTPIDPLALTQRLIRCASITPVDAGALAVIEEAVQPLGMDCQRVLGTESGSPPVDNLFARLGESRPFLCFAGHTDVVPPGDEQDWTSPPFEPTIRDGMLYGRGTSDMKAAIAAFIAAISRLDRACMHGSVGLLITGDEEGIAINGTRKLLDYCAANDATPDDCLVGEPTSDKTLGDTIKIGRRGSVSCHLTVHGTQGHVAYPQLAHNPIHALVAILERLSTHTLDDGNDHFQPSSLQITSIDTGNDTGNVIPASSHTRFNIRFNTEQISADLYQWIDGICDALCRQHQVTYTLDHRVSGEAFLSSESQLRTIAQDAVHAVTHTQACFSTSGGTSDARFITHHCPVIELGLRNATAHHVDEHVAVDDIRALTDIYEHIIRASIGG